MYPFTKKLATWNLTLLLSFMILSGFLTEATFDPVLNGFALGGFLSNLFMSIYYLRKSQRAKGSK